MKADATKAARRAGYRSIMQNWPILIGALYLTPTSVAHAGVTAGGPSCIATNRVIEKRGYNDSSRVEFSNRCGQPVSAWVCAMQGNAPSATCDARRGSYSSLRLKPGQTINVSMPSNARPIVDVRECPAGLNAVGNRSPLNCQ